MVECKRILIASDRFVDLNIDTSRDAAGRHGPGPVG